MKPKSILFICIVVFCVGQSFAQTNTTNENEFQFGEAEHFLDGYSLNFQYQDGKAIHMGFYNGKANYEWITGPGKGRGNTDIPYRSCKIGDNLYIVNWHETGLKDYLTIVFDFEKMMVHSSIIVGYENKPERSLKTVFLTGVIDHLQKK
ncbi:MoaF-related domain-containing protein [Maribacter polysaccharolyticus]|uniref:MoaF-related domain-containing protein n=1 Tax=Maribacter polysaccharolyticus TaxID=3020831 RepID=UPI00237F1214|nr:MoaF C-terminal domain-containing protein [Maribacter polysaccharolyticus]MDE3743424.1 MoaF C-terminal domain-containing protein [Maribacter polysaccharolyticus]